jgi:hypothetical protein
VSVAVILLHPDDNVLVCCRTLRAGETLPIGGLDAVITQEVELGHKIARVDLHPGQKVIKYGAPIGSMTAAAPAGGWVHMHNMKSDYISAHTRAASGGEP